MRMEEGTRRGREGRKRKDKLNSQEPNEGGRRRHKESKRGKEEERYAQETKKKVISPALKRKDENSFSHCGKRMSVLSSYLLNRCESFDHELFGLSVCEQRSKDDNKGPPVWWGVTHTHTHTYTHAEKAV
jgi:hypothetical protein